MVASIAQIKSELERSGLIRAKRAIKFAKEIELADNMAARAVDRKAKAEKANAANALALAERVTPLAALLGKPEDEIHTLLIEQATTDLAAGEDSDDESEVTEQSETDAVTADPEIMEEVAEIQDENDETDVPKSRSSRRGGRFAKAE